MSGLFYGAVTNPCSFVECEDWLRKGDKVGMNIFIIGSGGREHGITWKVCQSPKAEKVFVLPGNPGTSQIATNVGDVSVDDHSAVASFCKTNQIDLVIVGPEVPLADGLVDSLSDAGIRCFGPNKKAAEIESSKVFQKIL